MQCRFFSPKRSRGATRVPPVELKISPSSAAHEQAEAQQPLPPLGCVGSKRGTQRPFQPAATQECRAEAGAPAGNGRANNRRASAAQTDADTAFSAETSILAGFEQANVRADDDADNPNARALVVSPEHNKLNRANPVSAHEGGQWRRWTRPASSRPSEAPHKFATIETLLSPQAKKTTVGKREPFTPMSMPCSRATVQRHRLAACTGRSLTS